jgi:hypothetical protein
MNVYKIEIVQLPEVEGHLDGFLDVFAVKSTPYFSYDEEFFALYKTVGNCPTNAFSAFLMSATTQSDYLFIAVILCAVEETVSCFDCLYHLICRSIIVDFPSIISLGLLRHYNPKPT